MLNVSVSSGGAFVTLSSYLLNEAYAATRPRVIVWEVPIWLPALTLAQQRQLLGSLPGSCQNVAAEQAETLSGLPLELSKVGHAGVSAEEHRLGLTFTDLSLLEFDLILSYRSGSEAVSETLHIDRSSRTPNSGRYLFSLLDNPGAALTGVQLRGAGTGDVTAQLCN